jgi:signal transduction histidine kinase
VNDRPSGLHQRLVDALHDHLHGGGELALHAAYEIGREMLESRRGILDMTALVHAALTEVVAELGPSVGATPRLAEAEPFLLECYSPFEMAHQGAREANAALRRINEIREDEMKRLAHELHDQAGQMLAAVYLALDAMAEDPALERHEGLATVRAHLREVETQMRRISHEMRPTMLDDLGLIPTLRFLAEGIEQRAGLRVQVESSTTQRLPASIETALYRAAQEALTNAARHARASKATVRVGMDGHRVVLQVTDDGVGIASARNEQGAMSGLGLLGIRERVAPLGGTLEIHSTPESGTELRILVPVAGEEHATHPAG